MAFAASDRDLSRPASTSALLDQKGADFSFEAQRGRTVVLNFIFTGCDSVCPMQTVELAAVQSALSPEARNRVRFVSVTIDPEHDTPEALFAYASERGVDFANWSFVTGDRAAVDELLSKYGVFAPAAANIPVATSPEPHAARIFLINSDGLTVQRYTGAPLDQARLTEEIEAVDRLAFETAKVRTTHTTRNPSEK
jgi:protein SCO1/2